MSVTAAGTRRFGVKVAQTVGLQSEIFRIAFGKALDELEQCQSVTVGDHLSFQTESVAVDDPGVFGESFIRSFSGTDTALVEVGTVGNVNSGQTPILHSGDHSPHIAGEVEAHMGKTFKKIVGPVKRPPLGGTSVAFVGTGGEGSAFRVVPADNENSIGERFDDKTVTVHFFHIDTVFGSKSGIADDDSRDPA